MKILFILPSLSVGGLERVQVTIANALANRGHQVTVMTYMEGDALVKELDQRVRFIYKKRRPFPIMRKIPYIRHKFYDDGMWETRASAKRLHRYYIGKERYDVEIAFFRGMGIKTVSGCPRSNKCIRLAWVHSDFERASGYQNNFKSKKQVFQAYQSMHHVICVSSQAMESFKKVIGDTGNLSVIYNLQPVEAILQKSKNPIEWPIKQPGLRIVHVGRTIDRIKGHKRLADSVIRLHNEGFEISLVFVGDGEDRNMIQNHIKNCHAEDYIAMVGNQLNPYPYMKNADLLVCASQFEGFPLFVAESMICGTPVLSTKCTGPNEILDYGKYGMIVENSEEGIYKGIRELLIHPEKLEWMRKKTVERISFFDEKPILDKIENLFHGAKA